MTDRVPLSLAAGQKCKIIIRMQDGSVVRGYFLPPDPTDISGLAERSPSNIRELLTANCEREDGTLLDVDWANLKAVFFVSSFKGDRTQNKVRFYGNGPMIESIWVEITFADDEVIEGCIDNSLRHLQNDGFFLRPSSPDTNNLLIYVEKASIVKYRVLGVRTEELAIS